MNPTALHERTFAEYESFDLREWPTYEGWLEHELDVARRERDTWLEMLQEAKAE
jgi:hypothetical protein